MQNDVIFFSNYNVIVVDESFSADTALSRISE